MGNKNPSKSEEGLVDILAKLVISVFEAFVPMYMLLALLMSMGATINRVGIVMIYLAFYIVVALLNLVFFR
jgi:hypothetical protein